MYAFKMICLQSLATVKKVKLLALIPFLFLAAAWPQRATSAQFTRPMVVLYEGNNCTQDIVALISTNTEGRVNFKHRTYDNDEARSFKLRDIGYGNPVTVRIQFFDDPNFNNEHPFHDDFMIIETEGPIDEFCVWSFEPRPKYKGFSLRTITLRNGSRVKILYYYKNGLDGKVSSMDIHWEMVRRTQ